MVLTSYGKDSSQAGLEATIAAHGLENHVLVTGGIPDFMALLARADVFVRPTLVDGDSMSVREALSVGTPTVASDTVHRPPGVSCYRTGEVDDLVVKLDEALAASRGDPETARKESEANLAALLDIYRDVVSADRSR
jgi:glycosyltransferase involved in cell wall biosynthesis